MGLESLNSVQESCLGKLHSVCKAAVLIKRCLRLRTERSLLKVLEKSNWCSCWTEETALSWIRTGFCLSQCWILCLAVAFQALGEEIGRPRIELGTFCKQSLCSPSQRWFPPPALTEVAHWSLPLRFFQHSCLPAQAILLKKWGFSFGFNFFFSIIKKLVRNRICWPSF